MAAGIGLAIFACLVVWRYQRMQTTVAWLERNEAAYAWYYEVPRVDRLAWKSVQTKLVPAVGPAMISDIHSATIHKASLTDEQLVRLSSLTNLKLLNLASDQATDETLRRISKLRQLRHVSLSGDQFTFEGLLALRNLPRMRYLNLHNVKLSMAELAVLESALPLANLKYHSNDTNVYERPVSGRYTKNAQLEPRTEVGFAPLIDANQTEVAS